MVETNDLFSIICSFIVLLFCVFSILLPLLFFIFKRHKLKLKIFFIILKEHSVLVRTVQLIADLSRRRRATYGYLWVEAAKQSIRTNRDSWRHGYSPSRNQSYFLNSRPTLDLDESSLKSKVIERMLLDGSSAIIGLSATANNILQTYENLLSIIENKKDGEEDIEILNTTSIMVDRTEK